MDKHTHQVLERSLPHPLIMFTYAFTALAIGIAVSFLKSNPRLALFPMAFLFGWTQVASPCGMNIIGALTATGTDCKKWHRWLADVSIFTLFGLFTAIAEGTVVGWIGRALNLNSDAPYVWAVFAGAALLLAAREAKIIEFPLPQRRKASIREWSEFGHCSASAMWGIHIGLGFSTFINYGGYYILLMALLLNVGATENIEMGASIFAVYWIGRAASLWLAPIGAAKEEPSVIVLCRTIMGASSLERRIHAAGLACAALLGIGMLLAFLQ